MTYVRILKWENKCRRKKGKKRFWEKKAFRPRSLTPFDLPQVLRQMKDFIKLHNPVKFLEDSSFGSHFRDLQMLA